MGGGKRKKTSFFKKPKLLTQISWTHRTLRKRRGKTKPLTRLDSFIKMPTGTIKNKMRWGEDSIGKPGHKWDWEGKGTLKFNKGGVLSSGSRSTQKTFQERKTTKRGVKRLEKRMCSFLPKWGSRKGGIRKQSLNEKGIKKDYRKETLHRKKKKKKQREKDFWGKENAKPGGRVGRLVLGTFENLGRGEASATQKGFFEEGATKILKIRRERGWEGDDLKRGGKNVPRS